jgi:hypothetical protein
VTESQENEDSAEGETVPCPSTKAFKPPSIFDRLSSACKMHDSTLRAASHVGIHYRKNGLDILGYFGAFHA